MPFIITQMTICDTPEALAQFVCEAWGPQYCLNCPLLNTGYDGCLKHELTSASPLLERDFVKKQITEKIKKYCEDNTYTADNIRRIFTFTEIK